MSLCWLTFLAGTKDLDQESNEEIDKKNKGAATIVNVLEWNTGGYLDLDFSAEVNDQVNNDLEVNFDVSRDFDIDDIVVFRNCIS
jgi:hypothetical protein